MADSEYATTVPKEWHLEVHSDALRAFTLAFRDELDNFSQRTHRHQLTTFVPPHGERYCEITITRHAGDGETMHPLEPRLGAEGHYFLPPPHSAARWLNSYRDRRVFFNRASAYVYVPYKHLSTRAGIDTGVDFIGHILAGEAELAVHFRRNLQQDLSAIRLGLGKYPHLIFHGLALSRGAEMIWRHYMASSFDFWDEVKRELDTRVNFGERIVIQMGMLSQGAIQVRYILPNGVFLKQIPINLKLGSDFDLSDVRFVVYRALGYEVAIESEAF